MDALNKRVVGDDEEGDGINRIERVVRTEDEHCCDSHQVQKAKNIERKAISYNLPVRLEVLKCTLIIRIMQIFTCVH